MADFTPQAVRGVYPQAMLMGCGSGAFGLREGRKLKVAVPFTGVLFIGVLFVFPLWEDKSGCPFYFFLLVSFLFHTPDLTITLKVGVLFIVILEQNGVLS